MKTYDVAITETLHITYRVQASSAHWAEELVRLAILTNRDLIEGGRLGRPVEEGADDLCVYPAEAIA